MIKTFCTHCGKMFQTEANFCGFCGVPVHGIAAAEAHFEAAKANKKPIARQAILEAEPDTRLDPIREHLSPNAQILLMFNYLFRSGIVLVLGVIVAYFDFWFGVGVSVGYLVVVALIAYLAWVNFTYIIDDSSFQKEYGILFKRKVTIPLHQIQNVNVNRGLLDLILGLSRIDIETAGSTMLTNKQIIGGSASKAEGHLPGLKVKRARELHDILLARAAKMQ